MECRAFQAFLLSNYFITKALVNVRLYYERTIGGNKLNPKIEKLEKEIEKTKTKIAEMQAKLHKLEEQKTELENTDYVAVARSFKLTPQQLADFLKSQQAAPSETVLPQEKEDVHEA